MEKHYTRVLTIGVSYSGGCAGIQADLKTFSALGCFGTSAITSVSAQSTRGTMDIHNVSPMNIQNQIVAVMEDIGVDAVKIGMLHTCEAIMTVSDIISRYKVENLVLDPVMSTFCGDTLLKGGSVKTLREFLLPQTMVFTPNVAEAGLFLDCHLGPETDFRDTVRRLASLGCRSILLRDIQQKEREFLTALFYNVQEDRITEFCYRRTGTRSCSSHGTRRTLSAAIASFLALGCELERAVGQARDFLNSALVGEGGYSIEVCENFVHHFHKLWV